MIHAAAEQGNIEIFEILADPRAILTLEDGIGQQPFHYAAMGGSIDVLKYLLTKLGSKLLKVLYVVRMTLTLAQLYIYDIW